MKKKFISDSIVRFGYYIFVLLVASAIVYSFSLLAVPLIAGVLLSILFDPFVNYLETKGLNRLGATTLITCALALILALLSYLFVPRLFLELGNIASSLPQYKALFMDMLNGLQQLLEKKFPQMEIPDLYKSIVSILPASNGFDLEMIVKKLSSLFSVLSVVVIIPIVTFFVLADGHKINGFILSLVPNRYFEMTVLLFHKIITSLKLFIRGQLIDAMAVGFMTSIGLAIIGLPYAFVIGIIAGLGNLIPYLGPVIGFIPAAVVAVMSPEGVLVWKLLSIIIVFAVVQTLEGTVVYPIAVGKSVDLHPLIVIIGITVGGTVGGIFGMLIAIPLISIIKVSFEVMHTYLKAYSII